MVKVQVEKLILVSVCLFFLLLTLEINLSVSGEQHDIYLAQSLLQGKLYFVQPFAHLLDDVVVSRGLYYWPESVLPAFILTPFVFVSRLFSFSFLQGYLQFPFTLAIFLLIFKTAQKCGYNQNNALWLALAFCFSSSFLALVLLPWVWFFAQVMVVLAITTVLYEYLFGKRRYLLMGLFLGIAIATRINTIFALVFFLLAIIFNESGKFQQKIARLGKLLVFPFLAVCWFATSNWLRFGGIFLLGNALGPAGEWPARAMGQGILSIVHVPKQLYYLLLSGPILVQNEKVLTAVPPFIRGNPWGMSIFLMSPWLVYLIFVNFKDRLSEILLVTVLAIAIPLLFFYSTGARQLGYRYSMDFFPFLFVLLIRAYRQKFGNLSSVFKVSIIISAFFNLFLFLTIYGV